MRTSQGKVAVAQKPQAAGVCRHYWLIDTPSGPVSRGVCKLCGEEREFKNYLDTPYRDDDLSLDQVSTGAQFRDAVAPSDLGEDSEES